MLVVPDFWTIFIGWQQNRGRRPAWPEERILEKERIQLRSSSSDIPKHPIESGKDEHANHRERNPVYEYAMYPRQQAKGIRIQSRSVQNENSELRSCGRYRSRCCTPRRIAFGTRARIMRNFSCTPITPHSAFPNYFFHLLVKRGFSRLEDFPDFRKILNAHCYLSDLSCNRFLLRPFLFAKRPHIYLKQLLLHIYISSSSSFFLFRFLSAFSFKGSNVLSVEVSGATPPAA